MHTELINTADTLRLWNHTALINLYAKHYQLLQLTGKQTAVSQAVLITNDNTESENTTQKVLLYYTGVLLHL